MNQTLTQIQEEFDEKFRPDSKESDIPETYYELKDFLTQSNLRVLEKVKEMVEKEIVTFENENDYYINGEKYKISNEKLNRIRKSLSTLIEQK